MMNRRSRLLLSTTPCMLCQCTVQIQASTSDTFHDCWNPCCSSCNCCIRRAEAQRLRMKWWWLWTDEVFPFPGTEFSSRCLGPGYPTESSLHDTGSGDAHRQHESKLTTDLPALHPPLSLNSLTQARHMRQAGSDSRSYGAVIRGCSVQAKRNWTWYKSPVGR